MALWKPDPTFYPSARMAMAAPPETSGLRRHLRSANEQARRSLCAVDLDPKQSSYGQSRRPRRNAEGR